MIMAKLSIAEKLETLKQSCAKFLHAWRGQVYKQGWLAAEATMYILTQDCMANFSYHEYLATVNMSTALREGNRNSNIGYLGQLDEARK